MKAFIVDTEFDWGFQARVIGLSKTTPSYDYPPLTTFLGAIAESLARKYWLGEESWRFLLKLLASDLLALGMRPLNCRPLMFMDINKIISIRRAGKEWYPSAKYIYNSFDAPARGKTIFAPLKYESPRLRWFVIFKFNDVSIRNKKITLDADAFWHIHRIGSKESRVSVVKVEDISDKVEMSIERKILTNYSFPLVNGVIDPIDEFIGTWIYVAWIDPFKITAIEESMLKAYMDKSALSPFKVPVLRTAYDEPRHPINLNGWAKLYYYSSAEGYEAVVGRTLE
jgi:CRISPR-associated protein Cas5a/b/c